MVVDRDVLRFRPARESAAATRAAFAELAEEILRLAAGVEVLHSGGSSLPDALTSGDLDVHVRVRAEDFVAVREVFARRFEPYRREMWTDGFAAFVVPEASVPAGVALTVLGGAHDRRFLVAWEALARDPQLLQAYNALKLKYDGTADVDAYEREKADFFTALASQ